jgi:hypothetical protein
MKKIVIHGPLAVLFTLGVTGFLLGMCALCFIGLPWLVASLISSGLHCSMWVAVPLALVLLWVTGILRFTSTEKR